MTQTWIAVALGADSGVNRLGRKNLMVTVPASPIWLSTGAVIAIRWESLVVSTGTVMAISAFALLEPEM